MPRPEHFTNFTHCSECAEHDETLRSHTPATIGLDQLGHPGWDPICFVSDAGFHYYMPALARLAVDSTADYLQQFLFHLGYCPERIEALNGEQRAAVLALLISLRDDILAQIGQGGNEPCLEWRFDGLEPVIARLQSAGGS